MSFYDEVSDEALHAWLDERPEPDVPSRAALAEDEPGVFERECRNGCGTFLTHSPDTGTKWTQLCPSCLRLEC